MSGAAPRPIFARSRSRGRLVPRPAGAYVSVLKPALWVKQTCPASDFPEPSEVRRLSGQGRASPGL